MPFKLRLKKSRQYNVVSKNLFVISVELLDRSIIECTLSAESTGQDCLYNVCQRVGLHQPEFFGLRFVYKHHGLRWVEMGKPLKKQLEKSANELKLYLAVMFYILDVSLLYDEVTRYQYFLQLKKDITEGHLPCSEEQAILLVSYCLQAEFGNHDPEKHTTEYLKDFVLFPVHLVADPQKQEEIMSKVLIAHNNLQGLVQSAAEIHYIQKVQQLEGYGHEYFPAKDETGRELLLGVSLMGIIVKHQQSQKVMFHNWSDILRLTHHKKYLNIEFENEELHSATYQLEDTETAKYLLKLCIQQNKFFNKAKSLFSSHERTEIGLAAWRSRSLPNLQNSINHNPLFDPVNRQLLYNHEAHTIADLQHALAAQPELQYDEVSSPYQISPAYSGNMGHGSAFSIDRLSHQSGPFAPDTHPSSSSNLSLHAIHSAHSQNHINRQLLLPSYRPAPDYETAVQQKLASLQNSQVTVTEGMPIRSAAHSYESALNAFARMEHSGQASNFTTSQLAVQQPEVKSYSHYKNYDDLAHLDEEIDSSPTPYGILHNGGTARLVSNGFIGNVIYPQLLIHHPQHRTSDWNTNAVHALPPSHTYSTPELTSQGLAHDLACEQLINQFKPPPPYPCGQRSSSSTPDLASQGIAEDRHGVQISSSANVISKSSDIGNVGNNGALVTSSSFQVPVEAVNINVHHTDATTEASPDAVKLANAAGTRLLIENSTLHQAFNKEAIHTLLLALRDDTCIAAGAGLSSDSSLRSRSSSTQSAPEVMKTATASLQQVSHSTGSYHAFQRQMRPASQLRRRHFEKASKANKPPNPGPLLVAAMNGLSLSNPDLDLQNAKEPATKSKDSRCHLFESKLSEGSVFMEFEQILKKRIITDCKTAELLENISRNRFKDVLPYEDNRVRLTPSKDNKTGYINASHVSATVGSQQRFYIAAQGPLPNTVINFWQMVWEQNAQIIIMLTEVKEQGRDKCFPYWPQEDGSRKVDFGEYQITRRFSSNSGSFITCAITLTHLSQKKHRNIWHIQYTDWPDHGCPEDVHGFLSFMEQIDSVRRHAASELPPGKGRNVPMVVHCSAGVGRSGVTILCDIMIYCLDHNENLEVPDVLANLRQQRMLSVQTLAQYKFIYSVLIQYLKNSRLI